MKKVYYIIQISDNSNLIGSEVEKIKRQPNDGFRTEGQAETHLSKIINENEPPFNTNYYSFSIMPFYEKF